MQALVLVTALAASVAPQVEGFYHLKVTCPDGAGATICKYWAQPLSLTVMDVNGHVEVGIADSRDRIPYYLFDVTHVGADAQAVTATAADSVFSPASLQLLPSADGQGLVGALQDPSTEGQITLQATRVMSLASCTAGAAAWGSAGPQFTGKYSGMVNPPNGSQGTLLVQQGAAAFNGEYPPPLYFEHVTAMDRAAFTLVHGPDDTDYDAYYIKWCLASPDGKAWSGWAYGTHGYLAPLAFSKQ